MIMVIAGIRKEEDEGQGSSSVTRNFGDDKALDVAALAAVTAAQNLLQLSGEGSHDNYHKGGNEKETNEAEEGCDSSDRSITSRAIIEEIFGKEEGGGGGGGGERNRDGQEAGEVESETRVGPSCKRKRKLKSLEYLYEVTKPLMTR